MAADDAMAVGRESEPHGVEFEIREAISVINYGAAKAALANFSKALSKEVGPAGIRVNTVTGADFVIDGGLVQTLR